MTNEIKNNDLVRDLEDLTDGDFCYDIENLSKRDWYGISQIDELSDEFIRKYHDKLDWKALIRFSIPSELIISEFHSYLKFDIDWQELLENYELSENFLIKFIDKFDEDLLIETQKVSAKLFLRLMKRSTYPYDIIDKVIEYQIISPQKIEAIIKTFNENEVNWYKISKDAKMSDATLNKYNSSILWTVFSRYNTISEKRMSKYRDCIDWDMVSKTQKMSKDFIMQYFNLINVEYLKLNEKVDQKELEENGIYEMLILLQNK